jgi:predicted nucleic acid-binding protein
VKRYFIDTNIAFYAQSGGARGEVAQQLLDGDFVISAQVLNELAHATRRKASKTLEEIAEVSMDLCQSANMVIPLTVELHQAALVLAQRYNPSIYDALIIAAALEAGCDTLYSEDMQDGLVIDDRLTIRNPFAVAA